MSVQLELPCGEWWLDPEPPDDDGPEPPPLRGYGQPATAKPRPWRQVRRTLSRRITNLTPIDNYPWETQP